MTWIIYSVQMHYTRNSRLFLTKGKPVGSSPIVTETESDNFRVRYSTFSVLAGWGPARFRVHDLYNILVPLATIKQKSSGSVETRRRPNDSPQITEVRPESRLRGVGGVGGGRPPIYSKQNCRTQPLRWN